MARFAPTRTRFGRPAGDDADDDGQGLPRPTLVRLQARRAAAVREAADVLAHLPGLSESLHCIATHRLDLADIIGHLLQRLGPCATVAIATLGFNPRNLKTMLAWIDTGAVQGLTLLASIFFRSHNGDLWERTLAEFRSRKQRAACSHSHAKVVTLAFTSGQRLCVEGSANLCGSGSAREQFAIINDPGLCDWHARWINDTVTRHEGQAQAD
jgi:hypothetical protein